MFDSNVDNCSNENLIKIIFELKAEMSSYKKETDAKISKLENELEAAYMELNKKDNQIKKLEYTIVNMKEKHAKAVTIMKTEIEKIRTDNKRLKRENKEKDNTIKKLNDQISKLKKSNVKFQNILSKNSSNSSKPSSTDGYRKQIHNSRQKSDKPIGGQQNHKGSTLDVTKIKEIVDANKDNCIVKESILYVSNPALNGDIKYVIDTKLHVEIEKIKLVYKPSAEALPRYLKNTVTYGNHFKSMITLLNIEHAIPVKRMVDVIYELTDGLLKPSTGTIVNIMYELQKKVQSSIDSIKNYLLRCEVNHKDETMLYCDTKPRWFHVFSNKDATYYYYHPKRGNIADIEKGLLNIFTGTLVHDHMRGLYRFQCDHAECNAHILRSLSHITQQYKRKWSNELIELLMKIVTEIKKEMKAGYNSLRTEDILKFEKQFDDIIKAGYQEYKDDPNPNKEYNGEDMQLLRRLDKYRENHLVFMYDFRIPMDNNLAERDLRMIKAKKKISGCFRSDKGGEAYTDIKSYLSTMRKQGENLFNSLLDAFNNKPKLLAY